MTTTQKPLTFARLSALEEIRVAARDGLQVGRMDQGEPVRGFARYLCDKTGTFRVEMDVRDMFLRVRVNLEGETFAYEFWPVADLIEEFLNRTFWIVPQRGQ
jgi:hypothetical protein